MKFLCDRCKTRYSIGDDRVRGKILKIRCKNCNNVITVREGMPEISADEPRRKGQNTQAIEAVSGVSGSTATGAAASNGALGAAFASAMTKPPPALEEEWYVSIEGEQSGPFSLADAQRWVASKPFDAELHCWSEGFDDWLPVDKVSHFRGLRKKPAPVAAPAAPPPLPRAATGAQRAVTRAGVAPQEPEDEPKPLFAATMASLEKATQPPLGAGGFDLPPLSSPATSSFPSSSSSSSSATPLPSPLPASSSRGTPLGGQPAMPMATRTNGAHHPSPLPSTSGRFGAAPASAPHAPKLDPLDSATQIEAPPFEDESRTAAEPVASAAQLAKADPFAPTTPQPAKVDPFAPKQPADDHPARRADHAKADPFAASRRTPAPAALDHTQQVGDPDIDGDLDIGEVSRVVNLADLAKAAPPHTAERAQPVARQTGALPAMGRTGTVPALGRTGSVPAIRSSSTALPTLNRTGSLSSIPTPTLGPDGRQIDPATGEPVPLAPQVAVSHRRGMIALLVGALLLLGGAAAAVIYIVTSTDEGGGGGLVGYDVDTTRPDDPRRTGSNTTAAVSPTNDSKPQNPFVPPPTKPRTNPNTNTQPSTPQVPVNPNAKDLRPDEIEDMASKSSGTTQTCWRRSQRGAEAILLADLKKLGVTLTVDKTGAVTNVTLSDHATTSLGKCLISTIRGWKFRESTAGITARITLVFQGV